MSEHSPTPWQLDKYGAVIGLDGRTILANGFAAVMSPGDSQDLAKANAALIVAAVNSYATTQARVAELEAALRDIRDQEITELALDPDWARRIARAALRSQP